MAEQHRDPYSKGRDLNLSRILGTIRDDGPAGTRAESLAAQIGSHGTAHPGATRFGESSDNRNAQAAFMPPPSDPARGLDSTTWRRVAVVGGLLAGATMLVMLVAYLGGAAAPPPERHTTFSEPGDLRAELRSIQTSLRSLAERVDGLSEQGERETFELERRYQAAARADERRISALEQGLEQVRDIESRFRALAARFETIAAQKDASSSHTDRNPSSQDAAGTESSEVFERTSRSFANLSGAAPERESSSYAERAAPKTGTEDDPVGTPGRDSPRFEAQPTDVAETSRYGVIELHSESQSAAAPTSSSPPLPEQLRPETPAAPTQPAIDPHETTDADSASRSLRSGAKEANETQWAINLIALASKEKAVELKSAYGAEGIEVELTELGPSRNRGKLYGLRIPGFADREEAASYAAEVKRRLGIKEVWIYKYRPD